MKYNDHLFACLTTKQAERMLDNVVLILNSVQATTEENHIELFPVARARRREDFTPNNSSPFDAQQLLLTSLVCRAQ